MTQFAESNVLLAVLNGDENEALRLLREFYPGELVTLGDAAELMEDLVGQVRDEQRKERES